MCLYYLVHERKAQSESGNSVPAVTFDSRSSFKLLKDQVDIFFCYAQSVVANLQNRVSIAFFGSDVDLYTVFGLFDGIIYQVADNFLQIFAVSICRFALEIQCKLHRFL